MWPLLGCVPPPRLPHGGVTQLPLLLQATARLGNVLGLGGVAFGLAATVGVMLGQVRIPPSLPAHAPRASTPLSL